MCCYSTSGVVVLNYCVFIELYVKDCRAGSRGLNPRSQRKLMLLVFNQGGMYSLTGPLTDI